MKEEEVVWVRKGQIGRKGEGKEEEDEEGQLSLK